MENKQIRNFTVIWVIICIVNYFTVGLKVNNKSFDWIELIIWIVIHAIIYFLMLPLMKKLLKMDKHKQKKWDTAGYLILFYFSMILQKTHFASERLNEFYLWIENLMPLLWGLVFIFSWIRTNLNKKFIFIEIKSIKRVIGGILMLIAIFFLTNKPLENCLPKLFSWVEVTIAYVALFFSYKFGLIFEIKEKSSET